MMTYTILHLRTLFLVLRRLVYYTGASILHRGKHPKYQNPVLQDYNEQHGGKWAWD